LAIVTGILTGGGNSHETTSEEANQVSTDFVSEGIVGAITNTSGVAPATGGFAVNAQGSPDMTVAVSAGTAYVTATPSGQNSQTLRVKNSASANVTISANSSGSTKYDWIYISISAANAANPNTAADNVATLVASRSSSAGSDDGTPPTYGYPLAVVTVANGASSITNGNIADKRTTTGATPGDATILPYHFVGHSAQGAAQETSWVWKAWTPTLTNITAGSATTNYKYIQIGMTVHFRFRFTLGAGSAVGTNPSFSLPVAINTEYAPTGTQGVAPMHSAILIDNGTGEYDASIELTATANTVRFVTNGSTGTGNAAVTATAPFTWASGDTLWVAGSYETT